MYLIGYLQLSALNLHINKVIVFAMSSFVPGRKRRAGMLKIMR